MKSILLHAWVVHQKAEKYYLPYVHWVYLNEIVKYYDFVCLLSPIKIVELETKEVLEDISLFKNVSVYRLPFSESYISTIRYFFFYRKAYSQLKNHTVVYARYPIPFGWLQKVYLKKARRIIHFVGDPIDTIKNNPNIPLFKKRLLTTFFKPEFFMYLWACNGAKVFSNGYHIAERIRKHNLKVHALISTTLCQSDFYFNERHTISQNPKVIYVGYLRKAKGVETVINSFYLLQKEYPDALLTIVGTGESEFELKKLTQEILLNNVIFTGHVDCRRKLNDLLREQDIFCFASLSEGSPRVILEAMANGINVVSTPVGSLPYIFEDGKDIVFADFQDEVMFFNKMKTLIKNATIALAIRKNAFTKAQSYTVDKFIETIFV